MDVGILAVTRPHIFLTTRRGGGLEKSFFITTRTAFWMSAGKPSFVDNVSGSTKSRVRGNPDWGRLIKQTEAALDCKQQRGWKYNYEPGVITIQRQQFAEKEKRLRWRETQGEERAAPLRQQSARVFWNVSRDCMIGSLPACQQLF